MKKTKIIHMKKKKKFLPSKKDFFSEIWRENSNYLVLCAIQGCHDGA